MYDVIVVGSRCAGSPTAMLLARCGRRVLLVDRAEFPSDTVSGAGIQPAGGAMLKRWGLLERLKATGVPPAARVSFDVGPIALTGTPPAADGVSETFVPRRTVLDMLLVDAAAEAGAEVRERFSVKELIVEQGRVVGIRGRAGSGTAVEERATVVVGADGMHSFVARTVGAPTYREHPAVTVNAYSFWSGVDVSGIELFVRPNRFIVAAPTHDDLVIINQAIPVDDGNLFRDNLESAFYDNLGLAPTLADRVAAGSRVERFRFTRDTGGFFRKPYGPGWALVGDAGYHLDPITAQGMLDAFRDADLLASGIDRGLDGDLDSELASYHQARDETVSAMYEFTSELARLEPPPPEMQALLSALVDNQAETDRFFGVIASTVPVDDFFSPANIARVIEASGQAA